MIKPDEYKSVSDNLGESYYEGDSVYRSVGRMLQWINANDVPVTEINKQVMTRVLQDSYLILLQSQSYVTTEMSDMVRSLQDHIASRYGDVDSFLEESNLKVSRNFANLSVVCGYSIKEENIE